MKVPAYNPTDRPVVIDPDGRILGGREHATVDDRTDEVKAATASGHLVVNEPDPAPSTSKSKSSKRSTTPDADTPSADEPEES